MMNAMASSRSSLIVIPNNSIPSSSSTLSLHTRASHVPTLRHSFGHLAVRTRRISVVTRAGPPSTNTYLIAFLLPASLVAFTVLTSIRIADKLDRDYLEELAINQAIKEAEDDEEEYEDDDEYEYEDEDEAGAEAEDISIKEVKEPMNQEPLLSRTRNRPKREV